MNRARAIARADRARKREIADWPQDNPYITGFWTRAWLRKASLETALLRLETPDRPRLVLEPSKLYLDGAVFVPSLPNPDAVTVRLTNPNWRIA